MQGGEVMPQMNLEEKLKRATGVICKQGMVQFPLSDTAIAIIATVIGGNEEELDLIYAFRDQSSQTLAQLAAASGFSEEKVAPLASAIARKGLLFNQPNSAGTMVYRLLPLMLVGLMEYRFMVELTGSPEEKKLAHLFDRSFRDKLPGSLQSHGGRGFSLERAVRPHWRPLDGQRPIGLRLGSDWGSQDADAACGPLSGCSRHHAECACPA